MDKTIKLVMVLVIGLMSYGTIEDALGASVESMYASTAEKLNAVTEVAAGKPQNSGVYARPQRLVGDPGISQSGLTSTDSFLIAHYPFDDDLNNQLSGTNSTTSFGAISFLEGQVNNGLRLFNGWASSSVYISQFAEVGPVTIEEFSVGLWVKFETLAITDGWGGIVSLGSQSEDSDHGFVLGVDQSGGAFVRYSNNGNFASTSVESLSLAQSSWIYLMATVSANNLRLYANGELVESVPVTGGLLEEFSNAQIQLAKHSWDAGSRFASRFNGSLDEIRVFNTAVSEADASQIYQTELAKTPPLSRALVAHYPFDSNVLEMTGKGQHGRIQGSVDFVDGIKDASLLLNDESDHVVVDAFGTNMGSDVSFAFWFNPADIITTGEMLISNNSGDADKNGYLQFFGSDGQGGLTLVDHSGGSDAYVLALSTLAANRWYHIVVVMGDSSNEVYINGVLAGASDNFSRGAIENLQWVIGRDPQWPDNDFYGQIDDLKIYNERLASSDVQSLYQSYEHTDLTTGLVALYLMDGNGNDSSGNGNDVNVNGAVEVDGLMNKALYFDGENDVFNTGSLDTGTSALTMSIWVKLDKGSISRKTEVPFFDKHGSHYLSIKRDSDTQRKMLDFYLHPSRHLKTSILPEESVWVHLAATFDGTLMRIYRDGELVAEQNAPGEVSRSENPIFVASDQRGAFHYLAGAVDNVEIFNIALTPEQIKELAPPGLTGAPSAVNDTAVTQEDIPVNINVLDNDTDPDGDALTITAVESNLGVATITENNTIDYTPAENDSGADTFRYSITDGSKVREATVTVIISPVNDPPEAIDDFVATDTDTLVNIVVLENDTDVEQNELRVTGVSGGNGNITIRDDNSIDYTPAASFEGTDSFIYSITDGNGGSDSATVTVSVAALNNAPIAVFDSTSTPEDTPVIIPVLDNDSDPDGDPLTIIETKGAVGRVAILPDNTLSFTPIENFNGTEAFNYVISDGQGKTSEVSVNVTVTPVNDPPVANAGNDQVVLSNQQVLISAANSADVDDENLSYFWEQVAGEFTVQIVSPESQDISITAPDVDGSFDLTFQVTVTDPGNSSATDSVVVTVQSANYDSDGDGMPSDYEIANGLDPNDISDGAADNDNDGLSNLQEYQLGTNPNDPDTDGDGISDGQEILEGSNPKLSSTDNNALYRFARVFPASIGRDYYWDTQLNAVKRGNEDGFFVLTDDVVPTGQFRKVVYQYNPSGKRVRKINFTASQDIAAEFGRFGNNVRFDLRDIAVVDDLLYFVGRLVDVDNDEVIAGSWLIRLALGTTDYQILSGIAIQNFENSRIFADETGIVVLDRSDGNVEAFLFDESGQRLQQASLSYSSDTVFHWQNGLLRAVESNTGCIDSYQDLVLVGQPLCPSTALNSGEVVLDIDIDPVSGRMFMLVEDEGFSIQSIYEYKSDLKSIEQLDFSIDDVGRFQNIILTDFGYVISGDEIGVRLVTWSGQETDSFGNHDNELSQIDMIQMASSESYLSYSYKDQPMGPLKLSVRDHQFSPLSSFRAPDFERLVTETNIAFLGSFHSGEIQQFILDNQGNHYFVQRLFEDESRIRWIDFIVKTNINGDILAYSFPGRKILSTNNEVAIERRTYVADMVLLPEENNRLLVLAADDYDETQGRWLSTNLVQLENQNDEFDVVLSGPFSLESQEEIDVFGLASFEGTRYISFSVHGSDELGIGRVLNGETEMTVQGPLIHIEQSINGQFGPGIFLEITDNGYLVSNIDLNISDNNLGGGDPVGAGTGPGEYPDPERPVNNGLHAFSVAGEFAEASSFWRDNFGPGTQLNKFSTQNNKLITLGGSALFVYDKQLNRIQRFDREDRQSNNAKAIIVAGAGTSDSLWPATFSNANQAYDALIAQGFTKDRIRYLSHENIDLDNNGNDQDDVDDAPTKANFEDAITNWARDADDVVIYMVNHGDNGSFTLDTGAIIEASNLSTWVGQLDQEITGDITIVYDACRSGSFIPYLKGNGRRIFTSSAADQTAYFYGQGDISFSSFFWQSVANGKDLETAFTNATNSLSFASESQTPQVNVDDADLLEADDLGRLETILIGSGNEYEQNIPSINTAVASVTASDGVATIEINDVTVAAGEIGRVWGIVEAPDYVAVPSQPVIDLDTIEFTRSSGNTYRGTWDGFTQIGLYRVSIYARDRQGNTSPAITTTVTVEDELPSLAILVGSRSSSNLQSQTINARLWLAYQTLRQRGFSDDDIIYLSDLPEQTQRDDENTLNHLQNAIVRDLPANTRDLVIYFSGDGDGEQFYLADGVLTPDMLSGWLTSAQQNMVGVLTVILDTHHSGSWLEPLRLGRDFDLTTTDKQRIVITASEAGETVAWLPTGGAQSFGDAFWRAIRQNLTVGRAFLRASELVDVPAIEQNAMIDSNGDGAFESKRERTYLANDYFIGADVSRGSNNPFINSTSGDLVVGQGEGFTLWVDDITSSAPVTGVTADIIYPRRAGQEVFSERVSLRLSSSGRYQATLPGLSTGGEYGVMFSVSNANEFVSDPVTASIFVTGAADNAEADNTRENAVLIYPTGTPHSRTLHMTEDTDWFSFYAGYYSDYLIDVSRQGALSLDMVLYDDDNRIITQQSGVIGQMNLSLTAGRYFLRVRGSNGFDVDEGYYRVSVSDLETERATVSGFVLDRDGDTVRDARIETSDGVVTQTADNGFYLMQHQTGQFNVDIDYAAQSPERFSLNVPVVGQQSRHFHLSQQATNTGAPMVTPLAPGPTVRDAAMAYDYDGDNKADIAVRRPSTFLQYIRNSRDDSITRQPFGFNPGDIPVSGDFDGDGLTDIAVRRPSNQTWYILNSGGVDPYGKSDDGISRVRFGSQADDIPVPADYDGDGITDLAVRRPSTKIWYIQNSSGIDPITNHSDGITRLSFGTQSEDIPVPADYDGDGKADIAVRRPSTHFWYIHNSGGVDVIGDVNGNSTDNISRVQFGRSAGDIPVPADYDGDGRADLAVRRPSNQTWYIRNSSGEDRYGNQSDGISRVVFGLQAGDIPIAADYDGDGKADIAVRRPSTFLQYVYTSDTRTILRIPFGRDAGDIPIAAPVNTRVNMSRGSPRLLRSVQDETSEETVISEGEFHFKLASGE